MPTYLTKIRTSTGETKERLLTVPQESQLEDYLSRIDGFVIDCAPYESGHEPAPTSPSIRQHSPRGHGRRRSSAPEVVQFSWYLYTLLNAGLPLARSLDVIRTQMDQPGWREVIQGLIGSLEKGNSFADSLKRYPRFFPAHFIHLIDVGEISGQLDQVLERLAVHGEAQLETRSRVKAALIYPTILVVSCGAVVVFLVAFVLPRIARMFTQLEMPLPALTSFLLSVGTFLRGSYPFLIGGLLLGGAGLILLRESPRGRKLLGHAALQLPIFGPLYRKLIFSRYCQTLSLLHSSGVSLLVSLEVARAGLKNPILHEFFEGMEKNLREGISMGDELARCPYIPPLVTSMVSVGEETGRLSEMLTNITRFYDREIDQTVRSLPKLIEPVVIVIMTAVIGTIAASVFVPLATVAKGVR